jgi:outer membrane protein
MRNRLPLLGLAAFCSFAAVAPSALAADIALSTAPAHTLGISTATAGVTLAQAFERAIKVSESLALSENAIRELEARYREGIGGVLPHLSWIRTQFYQDTPDAVEGSTSSVSGTLQRANRPESYFRLTQPIFSGFREFNGLSQIKATASAARWQREQAAQNLLADLASVFYTSLDLEQEVLVLETQQTLIEDRLKELQRRVRLGKSRDSEVLTAQVDAASLEAQIEETRRALASARQTLYFLTEIETNAVLIDDRPLPTLPNAQDAVAKSAQRPDLRAAEETRRSAEYAIRYARGDYWPTLGFTGNYYTERVGFQEDMKWDALFTLTVPIFEGFTTKSQVEAAKIRMKSTELQMSQLKRQVRQQVETAHKDLQYALSQTAAYDRAVRLEEQNYRIQQQEYRLGLITNLDVLRILQDLQELRLRRLRALAAAKMNEVRLRVATGQSL